MKLIDLLEGLEYTLEKGDINVDIVDISYDSRKVKDGYIFVCINGYITDGHKFIKSAFENGAVAVLIMNCIEVEQELTVVKVSDTRYALSHISVKFFDNPSKAFNLIGVTGTKGKTTTTYMIKTILDHDSRLTGLIGTITNKIGDSEILTERTTPESYDLQSLFNYMNEKIVDSVVLEVSSHALDLNRVSLSKFDIGVFLNLTRAHLDFHGTFENYFEAKLKLFDLCKVGFVNVDSKYGKIIKERVDKKIYTFGIESNADIMAKNIVYNQDSVKYKIYTPWGTGDINIKIPGKFTIYNSLASIGVCLYMNVPMNIVKKAIIGISVPGRAEVVDIGMNFTVMVDYAHTPDSLKCILTTVKEFVKGRLICVFGCGGDRDKSMRPEMGKISGNIADFTIITSDNPRTENPESIVNEIELGIKKSKNEYIKIVDRKEAIKFAIKNARKDDIILLAGKGHETYQIFKDKTIKFNEPEIVKNIISDLGIVKK